MIKAFQTDSGIIVPAVTTDQMREVDRIAMEETGPNLYQMMENAGRTLAEVALGTLAAAPSEAVVVLAGPGGNGGGGICAARHLANRGVDVRLCLSRPDNLDPTTAFQQKVYRSASTGREVRLNELEHQHPALILDALIGYGLQGPPRGLAADLLRWANGSGSRILSLDVPSGLESTTGETPGEFIRPSLTLTLALPKTGLVPEKTGELLLADIGIPDRVYGKLGLDYQSPFGCRYHVPLRPVGGD